jgi:hypothetical protein
VGNLITSTSITTVSSSYAVGMVFYATGGTDGSSTSRKVFKPYVDRRWTASARPKTKERKFTETKTIRAD